MGDGPRIVECTIGELGDYHTWYEKEQLTNNDTREILPQLTEELWSITVTTIGAFQGIVEQPYNKDLIRKNTTFQTGISAIIGEGKRQLQHLCSMLRPEMDDQAQGMIKQQQKLIGRILRLIHGNHAKELLFTNDRNRYLHGSVQHAAKYVHTETDEDLVNDLVQGPLEVLQFQLGELRHLYRQAWHDITRRHWKTNQQLAFVNSLREDKRVTQYRKDRLARCDTPAFMEKYGDAAEERSAALKALTILNIEARQDVQVYTQADLRDLPRVNQRFLFPIAGVT